MKQEDETFKKLNLGSGLDHKEGYVNMDWNPLAKPDVLHDLNRFPFPFADNTFDLVEATHVLEHLDRPFAVMTEMHRILKPGGRLLVKVPHFSRGFTHAEHAHGFDVTFPLYFEKQASDRKFAGHFNADFELKQMRLKWSAFARMLPAMGYGPLTILAINAVDSAISLVANLSPNLCSRIWCFFGGVRRSVLSSFVRD